MTRKKPFSGKAKKQQLQEKRERNRHREPLDEEREDSNDQDSRNRSEESTAPPASGRGDLRTIFQRETKAAVEARKRDATRPLVYSADRGNSQSIYEYGIHDTANQLPILIKPKWSRDMTPEELIEEEEKSYLTWIKRLEAIQQERNLPCNLYERNIEVWRQLWRTIDRSDVIVHLADARCPVLHISDPLIQHVRTSFPAKKVLVVLTKADIVAADRVEEWKAFITKRYDDQIPVFPYNRDRGGDVNIELLSLIGEVSMGISLSEREMLREEDRTTLTIGFVGEPNVGKSSLLNALFDRKLVSVSATPGHTKHLQTHYFPHPERLGCGDAVQKAVICDCPGVVFPRLNVPVALQILFGSFPIAQTREPFSAVRFIAENCNPSMDEIYKLKPVEEDDDDEWSPFTLCEAYAKQRGFHIRGGKFDLHRGANQILRDTLNGKKVVLSFPPPLFTTQLQL